MLCDKRWINTDTEGSIIKKVGGKDVRWNRVVGELTKTMDFRKTLENTLVSKLN